MRSCFLYLLIISAGCILILFYIFGLINVKNKSLKWNIMLTPSTEAQLHDNYSQIQEITTYTTTEKTKAKLIYILSRYYGQGEKGWNKIFYRLLNNKCPVNDCKLTYDKAYRHVADAVLVNQRDHWKFPKDRKRPPGQIYIFYSVEHLGPRIHYHIFDNIFKWTMTYRRDSDIPLPYGRLYRLQTNSSFDHMNNKNVWQSKTKDKFAAWIVSHCITESRREDYIKLLRSKIKVDVYGKCSILKCGSPATIRFAQESTETTCQNEINQYMFYLAFENSICEDYVTEKFFKCLDIDVVPVVFGGADYKSIAPPNSYINALDFPHPHKLAEYLMEVANSEQLYNSFFEWKKYYGVEQGQPTLPLTCDICAKLHGLPLETEPYISPEMKTKNITRRNKDGVYSDMVSWYLHGGSCIKWSLNKDDDL